MTQKKTTLGRGLADLLGQSAARAAAPAGAPRVGEELARLPLDLLQRGRYQPRTDMRPESLQELADSIKAQGVVQPIVVRPLAGAGEGASQRYEIVAGERRWRAAQLAGLHEVPIFVRELSTAAAFEAAIIENLQREDLNPIEEAQGLKRLIDEFGITHDAAAKAVGRSRSAVTNLLRLVHLPKPVQDYVMDGAIDMGHARALLALPAAQQTATAVRVVNGALSVRETERLVHGMLNPAKRAARRKAQARDADTARLETEIAEALGAKVAIEAKPGGKGRIVIAYSSLDELEGIVARLKRP